VSRIAGLVVSSKIGGFVVSELAVERRTVSDELECMGWFF
jgi:hypothetical protein